MRLDLSLVLQITLVGDNYDGEEILVFHLTSQPSTTLPMTGGLTLRIC